MDELIKQLGANLAEEFAKQAVELVRRELSDINKQNYRFCYSEEEAAAKLNVCTATLYNRRKAGEIGYTMNPAGKPVYLPRHIDAYLERYEVRAVQPNK